jgi:hypothetical protein
MGESLDQRITNLKNIINKYTQIDQQYIADQLSNLININFRGVDFALSYRDLNTDTRLKNYLSDPVYSGILKIISDLKEYRALEKVLYQKGKLNTPSNSSTDVSLLAMSNSRKSNTQIGADGLNPNDPNNSQFNAKFNSQFTQQLTRNRIDRMQTEEKKLQYLVDNEPPPAKNVKLLHQISIQEFSDNLSNSLVTLFKQIYTFDINGLMNSQDNYIYYGVIFIFIYIVLKLLWEDITSI